MPRTGDAEFRGCFVGELSGRNIVRLRNGPLPPSAVRLAASGSCRHRSTGPACRAQHRLPLQSTPRPLPRVGLDRRLEEPGLFTLSVRIFFIRFPRFFFFFWTAGKTLAKDTRV